jgi:hypothetical protein
MTGHKETLTPKRDAKDTVTVFLFFNKDGETGENEIG